MSTSKTTRKARKSATNEPKPFTRSGLHRLECCCGNYTYSTVAAIETYGMPSCSACQAPFEPAKLELAVLLGADDAPVMQAWQSITGDKVHSQTRSLGGWHKVLERQGAGTLNSMDGKAFEEIVAAQRAQARDRRLNALMPVANAMPF
jgi:hypothetical protein